MKPIPRTLALALLFCSGAAISVAQPLRWKWAEGDTARYLHTQTLSFKSDAGASGYAAQTLHQAELVTWTVQSVDDSGAATLERTTDRIAIRLEEPGGPSVTHDTASEEPPLGMAALVGPRLAALTDGPMTVTVLPTGEISEVQLSEALAESLKRLRSETLPPDAVAQIAETSFVVFPEQALTSGDSWTHENTLTLSGAPPLQVQETLTYTDPPAGSAVASIATEATIGASPSESIPHAAGVATRSSTGEILFDTELGRLRTANKTHAIEITTGAESATKEPSSKSLVVLTTTARLLSAEESPDLTEVVASLND